MAQLAVPVAHSEHVFVDRVLALQTGRKNIGILVDLTRCLRNKANSRRESILGDDILHQITQVLFVGAKYRRVNRHLRFSRHRRDRFLYVAERDRSFLGR